MQWFPNIGFGAFGVAEEIKVRPACIGTCTPLSTTIGDIDGDHDVDVIVIDHGGLAWNENLNGLGSFGSSQVISLDVSASSGQIQLGDLDADGDLDLVAGASDLDSVLMWLENLGGRFSEPEVIASHRGDLFWLVDLDRDGDLDVQTAFGDWFESRGGGPTSLIGDLDGNGTVGFEDFTILAANFGRSDVASEDGDLNADSIVDFDGFLAARCKPSETLSKFKQ